jgi:NAD(P)H-quinone oxidoreductase subunit 5
VIPLSKSLARSLRRPLRIAQDILAYDFYTEKLYQLTVVNVGEPTGPVQQLV